MAPKKIKRKATAEPKATEVVEEKPTQEKGSDYESDEVRKNMFHTCSRLFCLPKYRILLIND